MTIDFFTPAVPQDRMHPNFRMMTMRQNTESVRNEFSRWARGFVDRDGKFVTEFQTTFNSSFWEIYINACHNELGWSIDYEHPAPDFFARTEFGCLASEATISNAPAGYRQEWQGDFKELSEVNLRKIQFLSTQRLSNSLVTKSRKYSDSYSKLDHVAGAPFAIWVAPFDQPFHFLQDTGAIYRVLYSYDNPAVAHLESGEVTVLGESFADAIPKDSGASIPLGMFLSTEYSHVSAVFFSTVATFGKLRACGNSADLPMIFFAERYNESSSTPQQIRARFGDYEETVLDGLHVFLNPFADISIPRDVLVSKGIAVHWIDKNDGSLNCSAPNGHLIRRMVCTFSSDAEVVAELKKISECVDTGKKSPSPPPIPEGELLHVRGTGATFVDHHLGHHRGWTILISRDVIDSDWLWMAKSGEYHLLGDFRDADDENHSCLLPLGTNDLIHLSEQAAFTTAKRRVDAHLDSHSSGK